MTPADRSRILVFGGSRKIRRLRQESLQKRGLADAVSSDEHDLLAAIDDGFEAGDHLVVPELLRNTRTLHRKAARWTRLGELDVGALDVGPREVGRLQAFDFLAPRRRLAGARAGTEAL